MARQSLPIGTYGRITTKKQSNGSWRAYTRYRDHDGITRGVNKYGPTKGKAEDILREALKERDGGRGGLITRDTKLSELADLWLAEKAMQEGVTEQSLDLYRSEIEVSDDKRASKDTIKIKSALGGLRVWEATTSRIDAHLKRIMLNGHREKARRQRVILSEMMSMAARHDAIDQNPVREVADLPRKRQKPRAADLETLTELREQLATWLAGKEIDGTPAHTSGPKRNPLVLDVADVELGTGPRPGEALALRWCDVELDATPPRLTFSGTIIRIKGKKEEGKGLIRQEWTKTDSGYRTVILPPFVVDTLRQVKAKAVKNDLDLVFPNRDGGIWDPHNFNRSWRQARGEKFAWVTPKTFRKTVASMLAQEHGARAAAQQLGHANTATTKRHYIDQPTEAPDFTSTLGRLAS
ncbi:tyrosine-type recombinase/integrase [Nocardia uniformis]|uniref:Tyrosine-type recombinase/integrase n=1 Tax=Nocardia uniformis TaxID=53432 RepID=A0A849C2N8_9NOCA|nr:tyrosine-type recombinase/integrase [Nocardia uniformis]NNH73003.1 tyrosine-type recombinase/integrase [Nocardia uniformis]